MSTLLQHNNTCTALYQRFNQLERHLSLPGHPYTKFGTGNLETLWLNPIAENRDLRAELLQWWEDHYCAGRMKLVVIGRQDLDTLEGWVKRSFEPVQNKGKSSVVHDAKAIGDELLGVSSV